MQSSSMALIRSKLVASTLVLSCLVVVASAVPIALAANLALTYRLGSLSFVSELFSWLPLALFGSGGLNVAVCLVFCSCGFCCCCCGRGAAFAGLVLYALAMLGLAALQLSVVYVAIETRLLIESQSMAQADIHQFAQRYAEDPSARSAWDDLQSTFACCGGFDLNNGFSLWKDVSGLNDSVPDSCCLDPVDGCGHRLFAMMPTNVFHRRVHTRGCMVFVEKTLLSDVAPMLKIYVVVGAALCLLQTTLAFMACACALQLREGELIFRNEADHDYHKVVKNGGVRSRDAYPRPKREQKTSASDFYPTSMGSTGTL